MASTISVVTEVAALQALHRDVSEGSEEQIACSPTQPNQPELGGLVKMGEVASTTWDVVALYDEAGEPRIYTVVHVATGRLWWLVVLGEENAATATLLKELIEYCVTHYTRCWGTVENPNLRAVLGTIARVTVEGNFVVKWV